MLTMGMFSKIFLSALMFSGIQGEKSSMSRQVIEKLSSMDKQAGNYAIGQKAAHQEFLSVPHLEKLPVVIKEMDEISITIQFLDLKEVENVGEKIIGNMVLAYPNAIQCSDDPICISRKGVAMSNFKGSMGTISGYVTSMSAVCMMRSPSIPIDVMTTNLDANQPADAALGFRESGYTPSSRRYHKRYEGVHNMWVKIRKSKIVKRSNAGKMRLPIQNAHNKLRPINAPQSHSEMRIQDPKMRIQDKRASKATRVSKASIRSRFKKGVRRARKKRALIGLAIGMLAVGTISNTIQVHQISSKVSVIGKEVKKMELRITNNKNHVLEIMETVGDAVSRNTQFDSLDQIYTMARLESTELEAVARSTTTGVLDPPTQRENMQIIDSMLSPLVGGVVDHAQFQEVRTAMVQTQVSSVEIVYDGTDRSCQKAKRKVTVVTARPLIAGSDKYVEVRPNVYKSLTAENKGSLFFSNTVSNLKASYVSQGRQVIVFSRMYQTWGGVEIRFHPGKLTMVDYISLILPTDTGVFLSTRCGAVWETHWVPNNTHTELPFFCTGFAEGKVFFRAIGMERNEVNDSSDSLLHNQSKNPLTVRIAGSELKVEINKKNDKFQQIEDKILNLNDKHDKDEAISIWEKILQWEPIVAGVAIFLLMLIFIIIFRKAFYAWSSRYLRGRYSSEYGQAARAGLEMTGRRGYFTKFAHPGARTNPLKFYPTLAIDKSEEVDQELVDYHQAIGTGPRIGATISVM